MAILSITSYTPSMRKLTIRLPNALLAKIESEARTRRLSKSHIVRERFIQTANAGTELSGILDLIGGVDDLAADLSTEKKAHLQSSGYGRKHSS
ncbi:CopG family transcriptional regulator [Xanthobacteraceae bacterium Astr-EGSB]|uniref:ribbon-helix-helix domain-containing protein n=1 Tax=Astrobacterium formosum TaxID=3069710 RepID=UPI0027B52FD9|nr:CopG family transcriptional regulator [Xanthobacteraceae bacterium Astr-EGSB]